eukprot:Colp12_sorted_trinity150504_noHs@28406
MTTFSLEKTAALVSAIPTNLGPQNDEIGTQEYIVAYHELIKFFDGLGKVFGFITSDVTSKLAKLEEHEIQGKKHHPWLIRKSVGVALYTLPARRQLLEWLSVTEADIGVHAEGLITKLREVYQNIETYYAKHDFLNLP